MKLRTTVPLYEGADVEKIAERAFSEMSAMGYDGGIGENEKGYFVLFFKDMGGIDTFLGRCQRSVIQFEVTEGNLFLTAGKHSKLDKILAFILGPLFWGFPWIFALIARSNRKRAEEIALNVIETYIKKTRPEEE